jgi:hypothetical protein
MNRTIKRIANRQYDFEYTVSTTNYNYFGYDGDKLVILVAIENSEQIIDLSKLTFYIKIMTPNKNERIDEYQLKDFYRHKICKYMLYLKENHVVLQRQKKLNNLDD